MSHSGPGEGCSCSGTVAVVPSRAVPGDHQASGSSRGGVCTVPQQKEGLKCKWQQQPGCEIC